MNKYLAGLYHAMLSPGLITEQTAGVLSKLLFANEVRVEDSRFHKVIVYQQGNLIPAEYKLQNGSACLYLYGNENTVVFEDAWGNRFVKNVDYMLERLMRPGKYTKMLAHYVKNSIELDIYIHEEYGDDSENYPDMIERYLRLADSEQVAQKIRREMHLKLLKHYYDMDDMRALDNYLECIPGDELGLEERMLTMTELEGDNSFIAVKQREDTIATLATINASFLTYAISVSLIVMVSISGFFGVGMTVVSALSATGTVPSGSVLLPGGSEEYVPQEYVIIYQVEGAGQVLPMSDESGIEQTVSEGLDAEPVMAVADEGWIFVSWSDGRKDPYRQEFAVYENKTLIAIFEEAELGEDLDEKDGEDEGKDSDNKPPNGQGGSQSNSNKPGNQNGGGSRYEPANQVIDGKTYYGGAVYEEAYDKALEEVNQDAELSDEEKDAIGGYFENIKK